MLAVISLSILVGSCIGTPLAGVWLSPIAPTPSLAQYHTQDGSGGYQYGYSGPHHAKTESSVNGITQGGYSYIDANGILQTVSYSADAENGFRVRASNLPKDDLQPVQDTPEVAAAKRTHLEELRNAELRASQEALSWQYQKTHPGIVSYGVPQQVYGYPAESVNNNIDGARIEQQQLNTQNPFLLPKLEADKINVPRPNPNVETQSSDQFFQKDAQKLQANTLPSKFAALPSVTQHYVPTQYVLPVLPYRMMHSSLHHTQDSLGQYDYTYTGDTSAKTESRSIDGTTRGAYSYVDANGLLQQVHYIADHNGFRVAATNLPEA